MDGYDEEAFEEDFMEEENNTLIGILSVVAKTGGIKITGNTNHDPEKWLNPSKEGHKVPSADAKGKVVEVHFDDKGYYKEVVVTEDQSKAEEIQKTGNTQTTQGGTPLYITLQNKRYVTHAGLMQEAVKKGLVGISTNLISSPDDETAVVKATVTMDGEVKGIYTGLGDANAENTSVSIAKHKIRMAETRAVNRALRFATNITECSIDELGEADKGGK